MRCTRCAKRGKTWEGSDPICAFDAAGHFNAQNWNCATMNALREMAIPHVYCGGESALGVIYVPFSPKQEDVGDFLILLTWYKSRGRISTARYSFTDDTIYPLKMGIAELALDILAETATKTDSASSSAAEARTI